MQGYGSDPMLWLYTQAGELVAQNDDWYGLQSNLDLIVGPGTYRLRAGFCCGDPDATRPGQVYDLQTSVAPITPNADPTTTVPESTTTSVESSTTTQPPETTSTTDAPTTTLPETTSSVTIPTTTQPEVTVAPTTSEQTTTTVPEVSTTVEIPTTTQEVTTTTEVATTTSDVPTTTKPTTTTEEPSTTVQVTTILPTSSLPLPPLKPTATTSPTTAPQTTTTTEPPTTSTTQVLVTTTLIEAVPPETSSTLPATAPEPTVPEPITELPADIQNLTMTEKAQLVEQLNAAPVELKREFEETVNVFGGGFDNYVPADQRVPVGTRRTLIAVTAAMVTLSTTAPARRNRS